MADYEPRLTCELWPLFSIAAPLNDLAQHFDLTWQDLTSDAGTGEVKVPVSSPDAADIEEGTQVRCYVDGVHRFTWTVEDADKVFVSRGEELEEVVHARGRGSGNVAERTVVYPFGGVSAKPVVDDRVFNFGAGDYDDSAWTAPVDLGAQSTGPAPWTDTGSPAPLQWPDPAARWLWGDADNTQPVRTYFRTTFVVPSTKRVAIFATGDDDFTVYLNGVPILAELDALWPFRLIYRKEQELPAGTYTLAAVVENAGGGVGGFLASVWTISANGNLDVLLRRTDTTNWVALYDPADAPGLTPGAILSTLIDETVGLFTYNFDAVNDSAGDPWPLITDWSVPIGTPLLAVLAKLAAEGWIDWEFVHGNVPALRAYNPEGGMTVTGVTYTAGVNIAELSHKLAEPIFTSLLVKWPRGYWRVFDNAAIAVHGPREGFYTVDVDDFALMVELANRQLDRVKAGDPAIVLSLEHAPDTNAEPYVDFALGDKVNAPNKAGASTSYRVLGITVVQDLMGDPSYTLELNRRGTRPVLQLFDLLRAISGGSIGALGGGTTPVTIPGGTGSTGGGSTGGDGGPGDYDPSECVEHEDDSFSEDPYSSADVYVPNICLPDTVREQVAGTTLSWGPGFFGPLAEIDGDREIEANAFGGLVLYGTLPAIDAVTGDVSVAVNLTLLSTEPPGSSYQLVMEFSEHVTIWAKDDGGSWSVKVEITSTSGTTGKARSGLSYDRTHSIVATHADGGDFHLVIDGVWMGSTSPMDAVDLPDGGWTAYLPALASFGKAALWGRALDPDEVGFIVPPDPPPSPLWGFVLPPGGGDPAVAAAFTVQPGDIVVACSAWRNIGAPINTPNAQPPTGSVLGWSVGGWTDLEVNQSYDNFGVSAGVASLRWAEVAVSGALSFTWNSDKTCHSVVLLRGLDTSNPIEDHHMQGVAGPSPVSNLIGVALEGSHIGFLVVSTAPYSTPLAAFSSTNAMTTVSTMSSPGPFTPNANPYLDSYSANILGCRVLGGGTSFGLSGTLSAGFDNTSGGWIGFVLSLNYLL